MKTLVYQSYRTVNVPGWISQCMVSVQAWAQAQGFEYRFVDDRLFDYVPDWYRQRVQGGICLMADLARLELAREYLATGYDRAIWIDADVLVFDPERFRVDVEREYAFCKELWIYPSPKGGYTGKWAINNSVCAFVRPNSALDFLIHACKRRVASQPRVTSPTYVGTDFLKELHKLVPFQLLSSVGLFGSTIMAAIAQKNETVLRIYAQNYASPIYAANLCHNIRSTSMHGVKMEDSIYESVIEQLLATRGDIINRHLTAGVTEQDVAIRSV